MRCSHKSYGPNKQRRTPSKKHVLLSAHANGYPKPECPQLPSPGPPGLELWDTEELVPQVLPADDDLFRIRVRVRVRVRVRALPRLGLGLGLGLGLN